MEGDRGVGSFYSAFWYLGQCASSGTVGAVVLGEMATMEQIFVGYSECLAAGVCD
jgi:hypothetical protein